MIPFGVYAALIACSADSFAGSLFLAFEVFDLSRPMPCSALIEPPNSCTRSWIAVLIRHVVQMVLAAAPLHGGRH